MVWVGKMLLVVRLPDKISIGMKGVGSVVRIWEVVTCCACEDIRKSQFACAIHYYWKFWPILLFFGLWAIDREAFAIRWRVAVRRTTWNDFRGVFTGAATNSRHPYVSVRAGRAWSVSWPSGRGIPGPENFRRCPNCTFIDWRWMGRLIRKNRDRGIREYGRERWRNFESRNEKILWEKTHRRARCLALYWLLEGSTSSLSERHLRYKKLRKKDGFASWSIFAL